MAPAMRVQQQQVAQLRCNLLSWYRSDRRALPWRRSRDPYRIWLAEIMLQQTRIGVVIPYYELFLRRFPEVRSLARARESEVLKYWAGLGYYSRARNLHRAAKAIVREHGKKFPKTLDAALALPGVGRYTAAAILSIAYDVPLAALDGNVARVLARLFAFRGDIREPKNRKQLHDAASVLIPKNNPGDWNQALMELGETICTPRAPRCGSCPVSGCCKADALGLAEKIPAPLKKPASVPMTIAVAVLCDSRGRTLLTKSPGQHDAALFSRMWQFPAVQITDHADPARILSRHLRDSLGIAARNLAPLQRTSHSVTFRKLTLLPYLLRVPNLPRVKGGKTLPLANLARVPVSSATKKISRAALASSER
jgi:A/G-specific adenine glycosylase